MPRCRSFTMKDLTKSSDFGVCGRHLDHSTKRDHRSPDPPRTLSARVLLQVLGVLGSL
jgi:hypothetical protein